MLGFDHPYWTINREERNYAALLYSALLTPGNLGRFLEHVDCPYPVVEDEVGAYFEYAYLRDLWEASRASNDTKRAIIRDLLGTEDFLGLNDASVMEWNRHFGVVTPATSDRVIQSPSRWSLTRFHETIIDNDAFLETCRFKWSFNIKPDLVIHPTNQHAVVIEAKFASGEGYYPTSPAERAIFKERGLQRVGQTALQEYMFKRLLGIDCLFLFVVNDSKARSETHRTVLWSEIFSALDMTRAPAFTDNWLRQLAVDPPPA